MEKRAASRGKVTRSGGGFPLCEILFGARNKTGGFGHPNYIRKELGTILHSTSVVNALKGDECISKEGGKKID